MSRPPAPRPAPPAEDGDDAPLPPLPRLTADCAACKALCCVALVFDKGDDFAFDKPAYHPCPHLTDGFACAIHDRLEAEGFAGCARYDCLGAGQRVIAELFPGADWRRAPQLIPAMAEAFLALRRVHADLELLAAARALPLPPELRREAGNLLREALPPEGWTPATLARFAGGDHHARVARFLRGLRAHV